MDTSLIGTTFTDRFTGTLTQPPTPPLPGQMWDGTATGPADPFERNLFTIDSSQVFGSIPEPSSLALIGTGLLGLAGLFRKKKV